MSHGRKISVIGLGYVGLPVAVAFGKQGRVVAYDNNPRRIRELKQGADWIEVVTAEDLEQSDILFTDNAADLVQADFHIIAVPTPINAAKQPDLSPLLNATEIIGQQLKAGDIVVYESTVYPGATEEECVPILERLSGLTCGKDFQVGYSPERINPGDTQHTLENTVKVVSAQNNETLDIIAEVYSSIVKAGVHKVSSIKAGEAAKVIENTQRDLNIALMNELALIFNKMKIDTNEVLQAAGTKWNFLPFRPGLVGGHCIGVDPYYLTYKASVLGYSPQVILAGRSINDAMGRYVARMVIKQLINAGQMIKGSTVTVLGATFKENVPDLRNTRVLDLIEELESFGVNVQIYDPVADVEQAKEEYGLTLTAYRDLQPGRAVIMAVSHRELLELGWPGIEKLLIDGSGIVFDVKSVLLRETKPKAIELYRL
ncbi:MAG: nucleotide sugar dehydrogenase [Gammaproteobacteria bacterium]|nr:nucleotide sugar dehydrogenase [Gammaproteobacteria bacterium]